MPYVNLHWKGLPHHLPQIRVASTPSVSVRNRSDAAARQVLGIPLGADLERERKKHRFNFRIKRRRGRSSRASATILAKRAATQRARQNIQVFGWDTPNAELASRNSTEIYFGSRRSTPRPPQVPPHVERLHETESAIPSTDGAAVSFIKRTIKRKKSKSRYSLMQVAELPTKPQSRTKFSFDSDHLSINSGRQVRGEYAHANARDRTYDTRINPSTRAGTRKPSAVPQVKTITREDFASSPPKKRQQRSFASPEVLEAVNSLALKSKKEGSKSPSIRSLIHSVLSDQSRTPRQKRALRRYTREIELYLQAARTLPKHSLIPSLSATSISANTIQELRPYQSQFQSAGLAVTSKDQRGETILDDFPTPPRTPPKDKKWENMPIISRKSRVGEEKSETVKAPPRGPPSYASGSTGTTVLGFTPPHEKSYPRAKTDRKKPSLDSDHTVLGFTPPHERMVEPLPPVITASDLRPSPKRSLPWLRRNTQFPEASPTRKMTLAQIERSLPPPRPSDPLQGWAPSFDISPEPSPESEKVPMPLDERKNSSHSCEPILTLTGTELSPRRSSASKWRETRASSRKPDFKTAEKAPSAPARPTNVAADDILQCHHANNYVNTAVQADVSGEEESTPEVENASLDQIVERGPLPSRRYKTFPIPPNKCRGECAQSSHDFAPITPPRPSRTSRVTWQGIESSTQTEAMNSPIPEKPLEKVKSQQKTLVSPPPGTIVDRSKTFPSPLRSVRSSTFVQQAPRMRTPNKSFSERKSKPVHIIDPAEEIPSPPTRQPPAPPVVCSQCAGPVERDPEPEIKQESEAEGLEDEVRMPIRAHACASRSSMLCQQCFPSRQASLEMSPLQAISPVEVIYLSSSRRSTRPTVPTGPVTYVEIPAAPVEQPILQVRQCLDSTEGREMHRAMVKETVEEFTKKTPVAAPMKRPSISHLNLKPPPVPPKSLRRPQSFSYTKHVHKAPQRPLVIATACPLDHVAASSTSVDSIPARPGQVSDKQVFRGLHVATAAACDEDVDKWIEEITGTGVRRFLADLSAFEGLGVNTLANVAKRAAKQRREQLRAWEEVRERKLASQSREMEIGNRESGIEDNTDDEVKVGDFVVGDQGVQWVDGDEQESQECDTLIEEPRAGC